MCKETTILPVFSLLVPLRYAPGEMIILEGSLDEHNPDDEDENDAHELLVAAKEKIAESIAEEDASMSNAEPDDTLELDENASTESPFAPAAETGPGLAEEPRRSEPSEQADDREAENQLGSKKATELPGYSGISSYVYIIASGNADVWHQKFNSVSLGPGTTFGEGGFLFRRQHSASVVASPTSELKCWVVPGSVFRKYVLPSESMMRLFVQYASRELSTGEPYMTMVRRTCPQ